MDFMQPAPQAAGSEEIEAGLRLLEHSQALLRTIFLGLALQYHSLDLQRCQLLQAEDEGPLCGGNSPVEVQTAASLITLCALFGFQQQTEDLAAQTVREGQRPDLVDVKLGAAVILIALIRLFRLQRPGPAAEEEEEVDADLDL